MQFKLHDHRQLMPLTTRCKLSSGGSSLLVDFVGKNIGKLFHVEDLTI